MEKDFCKELWKLNYNVERSKDDLCAVGDWNLMLEELQEITQILFHKNIISLYTKNLSDI